MLFEITAHNTKQINQLDNIKKPARILSGTTKFIYMYFAALNREAGWNS